MLKFYYANGACSMGSHIGLEETGIAYEAHRIALDKKENFSPDYLTINRRGKVPALVVGDRVITENVAILTYLARVYPRSRLMPDDPIDAAHCIETVAWLSNGVHPHWTRYRRAERFSEDPAALGSIKEMGLKTFWKALQEIDGMLEGRTWMAGDSYTICDPYALVFLGWGKGGELPIDTLPNASRWVRQMLERPAVRRVLEKEGNALLPLAA